MRHLRGSLIFRIIHTNKHIILATILLIIPGFYILSLSIPRVINRLNLLENGVYTMGTVVSIEKKCKLREYYGKICDVETIEFVDSVGRTIRFDWYNIYTLDQTDAKTIGVYFSQDRSDNAVVDDQWRIILLELRVIITISSVILVMIVFGILPAIRNTRRILPHTK